MMGLPDFLGQFLETEVNLLTDRQGLTWGFDFAVAKSSAILQINENGDWTEIHNLIIGTAPERRFMDIVVHPRTKTR